MTVTAISNTVAIAGTVGVSGAVTALPYGATVTQTVTGVASGAPSLLVAANPTRKSLLIANASGTTMYVGTTSGVTLANGVPVIASQLPLYFDQNTPVNAFYGIASASGATAVIWEGN
jgi:hypothetical protein